VEILLRTVWLDLETTGLNTEYTNIVGLAYWPEIKPRLLCPKGPRYLRLQPILHMEDHIYGGELLESLIAHFNIDLSREDPEYLLACVLKEGTDPLFSYSRGSLTFQMPVPEYRNPADWLLDKTRISPAKGFSTMLEDLDSIEQEGTSSRWTVASYNSSFDVACLKSVARRSLGDTKARSFLNNFSFFSLDILQLARWGIHSGSVPTQQASLKIVAAALKIPYEPDPDALALSDLKAAQKVAQTLLGDTNALYSLNQPHAEAKLGYS